MPNRKTFEYCHDKFKTSQLLSDLNLPFPWTRFVADDPISLPCIIKNRGLTGKGNVHMVDIHSLSYFRQNRPNDIWQEYLSGEEYTCGLFGLSNGNFHSIIFKRKLSNGNAGFTVSGEVVHNEDIENCLSKLAIGLDLRGSCNIQLRLTSSGPIIFEINPRFSSTVMFRHLLGFQDVVWSCNEALGLPADARNYDDATAILKILGYTYITLITNNPLKEAAVEAAGITFTTHHVSTAANEHNQAYLDAKINIGKHHIK
jgi:carbamoyl-phosphate synthase large subunit